MAEYGVDISVRVKRDQVDQLGRLLDNVEKQVGKLNRVKVNLDASPANRALDALNNRLREAEQLANRFSGSNKIRSGIGAFSTSIGELSKELASVRAAFDQAKSASDKQARALELLSGQFKKTRLEGQAFANASARFFDEGLGTLNERLKEIEKLPRNLFSSGEAIRELTYLQSLAVQGTEEWLTVSKALGRQLEINSNIRLGAQRAQGPMPQDPFGTKQLLLPAAGQTSGTFSIIERQVKAENNLEQSAGRRARIQAKVTELKELEAEQAERLNSSELASIRNQTRSYQQSRKARAEGLRAGLGNVVIGGAFPLLFGQGPGAALGGAVGGGIGSRFGGQGGFAGSLAGTFAGQATIDFAINSAVQLAKAVQKPTENIQELIKFLGVAGTEFDANVQVLQKLGMESTASAIALAKLEDILKAEGYKNLDTLSDDLRDLENAFSRLKLAAANILAEPLTKFLNWLTDTLKLMSKAGGVGGFITTSPTELQALDKQVQAERAAAEKVASSSGSVEAAAQKLITDEQNRQLSILTAQVSLERDRLSLTRVALASRQGEIEIMRVGNELTKKSTERQNEKNAAKQKELDLDIKLLKLQKQQAEEARKNAIIEAERQVRRDLLGQFNQQFTAQINNNNLLAENVSLVQGELAGIKEKRDVLSREYKDRLGILFNEREMALMGINELEVRKQITKTYNGLATILHQEIKNRQTVLNQQEAQYNLTQLQVQQQRELANVQTRTQMGLELANIQAGTDPRFFGFFGGSQQSQELLALEMQARLGTMQAEAAALAAQGAVPGLDVDTQLRIQQQTKALEEQIAIYERYQPAIINASVAQQRFNEALALTTPVVDSVFNSFMAVAEGTATAQEAFANFLRDIANMLIDTVKIMIAQYIALGIARMFAGVPAGGEPRTPAGDQAFMQRTGGLDLAGSLYKRANGGPVSAGTPYLVGERGPEMFVPRTSGSIYPNDVMGGGGVQVGSINISVENKGEQLSPEAQKRLANQVQGIVMATLVNQKRSGGML